MAQAGAWLFERDIENWSFWPINYLQIVDDKGVYPSIFLPVISHLSFQGDS